MLTGGKEMVLGQSRIVMKPTSRHATIMAERLPSPQLLVAPILWEALNKLSLSALLVKSG